MQWEDFAGKHARPLLEKYHDQFLTFNDDIQGTAAVVLGCAIAAGRALSKHSPVFQDQTAAMLPPLHRLRDITRDIAFAVGKRRTLGLLLLVNSDDEFRQQIAAAQWCPAYPAPADH